MASILPGYDYDIFISYRQKDNKHDHWVTEFVTHLRGELGAAFKEDISIYFDANPLDGLLEVHDVDKSLQSKLNCIIFIPVISQTYCDPKSFAWQHEFCAFNRLVKESNTGRDIKLSNGNVISRILPVVIHDLDPDDMKLFEDETGAHLRGIEFIFESTGVNRPLHANEDHPQENLKRTYYRDQINKAANAIKDIINALKKAESHPDTRIRYTSSTSTVNRKQQRPILIISILVMMLLTAGIFAVTKLIGHRGQKEKSIAVLPFKTIGDKPEDSWFSEAITDQLITQLGKIKEFDVRSRTTMILFKETHKSLRAIGKELNVNYIIEGSVQRIEDRVKINVNLLNTSDDNLLWGEPYESNWVDIASLQSRISKQIAEELQTALTPEEKQRIEKTQANPQAYNYYLQGRYLFNRRVPDALRKSIDYFSKSVQADPDYCEAYTGMADAYSILAWWGWYPRKEGYSKAKEYALKALDLDQNSAEAHAILGTLLCWSEWKWEEAGRELKLATELNPKCSTAHQYYAELLDITGKNEEAREEINAALRTDPYSTAMNAESGLYYYNEGRYDDAVNAYMKTLEINPDFYQAYFMIYEVSFMKGDTPGAFEAVLKYLMADSLTVPVAGILKEQYSKSGFNGVLTWLSEWRKDDPSSQFYLAKWYSMLGRKDDAIKSLEKVIDLRLSNSPDIDKYPDEIPRIFNSPVFRILHPEPGFQAIIKKLGLQEFRNMDQ